MSNTLDKKLSQSLFAVVGLFVAFMLAFGGTLTASAQSNEDLENQVSSLLDTIEQLQSRLDTLQDGNGGSATTGSVDYTFTSNLSTGDQGVDVLQLQQALNADTDTRLAATGAGSPGQETNYYGSITANAVTRFQEKYASDVLFPVGLTNGTGYFGPSSRAKMNSLLAANNVDDEDEDMDDDEDMDNDDEDMDDEDNDELDGGEASLEDFDLSNGDDNDVSEGDTAEIADVEFEVEDGDVRVDRMDISFVPASGNEENDPWDAFDEIMILDADGDEIASEAVDDEDDWLDDEEPYQFRMSNLDTIVRDGDMAEMTIALTAAGNVDGADDNAAGWELYIDDEGIRATDGDDIQQYTGDDNDEVSFDIEEEGDNDEFEVRTSSDDPNASTIQVEDDDTSDNFNIFTFALDADDSDSDIEIDQLPVLIEIDGERDDNGSTTDATYEDVIDDLELEIDGETFDDFDVEDMDATSTLVTFDIDDDYTLEAGDEVDVALNAEFQSTDDGDNYFNGTQVRASVNSDENDEGNDANITGEGADDIIADGSATGDEHTLRTSGIFTENGETDTDTSGENDTTGVFTFNFDAGAFDEDFFIARDGSDVDFTVQGSNATTTDDTSITVRAPGADREGDFYRITEGDTENVRVTVSVDPTNGGLYSVQLNNIEFFSDSDENDPDTYEFTPEEDYETNSIQING